MPKAEKVFIVEQGGYAFRNFGDSAMLEVTLQRILERYPVARMYVVSNAPERLAKVCPQAQALAPETLGFLEECGGLFGILSKRFPLFSWIERALREHAVRTYIQLIKCRRALRGPELLTEERDWIRALFECDAVVCSGGGFVNDIWAGVQSAHLMSLRFAQRLKKKTAMFGQGIGPLCQPDLIKMFGRVANQLDMLTVREPASTVDACRLAQVERFTVCGDDALALCASRPAASPEGKLGLNIRIADYANMPEGIHAVLRTAVSELLNAYEWSPCILPISTYESADDVAHSAELIESADIRQDAVKVARQIESTQDLIDQVSRCNLTITGSYHAAVFSLGLGVPVICLSASDYYQKKFSGLAACFDEVGIKVLDCYAPDLAAVLKSAAGELLAVDCRAALRAMMAAQVAKAEAQYARFFGMLDA